MCLSLKTNFYDGDKLVVYAGGVYAIWMFSPYCSSVVGVYLFKLSYAWFIFLSNFYLLSTFLYFLYCVRGIFTTIAS